MKILSKAKGNHGLLELDSSLPQTVTSTVYFDKAYFNNVPFVDVDNVSVQLATLNSLSVTTNTKEGVHIATLKWGLIEYELYAPMGGTTDLTNYMTLNTAQTITGVKTFGTIRASKIWGAANNSTFVDFSNDEDTIIGASGCIVLQDEVQLGSTYQYGFRPDGAGTLLSLTLTDALPIASGGTGATTVDSARTNLGLGSAATYAVASSVTPTGTGLTTSKAVYDALGMYYTTAQVDNLLGSYVLSSSLGTAATKSTTTSVTSESSALVTSGGVYSYAHSSDHPAYSKAAYDFRNGYLVKTSIEANKNIMFIYEIQGFSYNNSNSLDKKTFQVRGQAYNYNTTDSILQKGAVSYGESFGDVKIFNYNGYVHLWFEQVANFQSFFVKVFITTNGYAGFNRVESITNSSIPTSGVTRLVSITPFQTMFTKGDQTLTGNLTVTGTVTQGSDFFRKNILEDVLFTVEDIAAAPLVKFQWNDMPEDSSVHIGSIAQYWQKILPEAVHGEAGESLAMEYQTIALGSSIITAREVVKLKEEINALKKRVKELDGSE